MQPPQPARWRFLPMGEAALLAERDGASDGANRAALTLAAALEAQPLPGIEACVPAIRSLLVRFDPLVLDVDVLREHLARLADTPAPATAAPSRIVAIPVRYGGDDGPDLEATAARLGLSPAELVREHSAGTYRVMMIGFAPGYPYIGPLPARLTLPRRDTPRVAVPAGSVAIAVGLSGIYPTQLPGGWHLIGRTPLQLFDPHAESPALLRAGDGVRFVPLPEGVQP